MSQFDQQKRLRRISAPNRDQFFFWKGTFSVSGYHLQALAELQLSMKHLTCGVNQSTISVEKTGRKRAERAEREKQ